VGDPSGFELLRAGARLIWSGQAASTSKNNRFQANVYFVPQVTKKWWFWNTATRNWTEWQAARTSRAASSSCSADLLGKTCIERPLSGAASLP
jgi:hypothetical protein